jgi:hypothetical protein
MEFITDIQAESLRGGRLFAITVAPTIVVSNAITTALQGNLGNAIALSPLGGPAFASLGQLNGLSAFNSAAA